MKSLLGSSIFGNLLSNALFFAALIFLNAGAFADVALFLAHVTIAAVIATLRLELVFPHYTDPDKKRFVFGQVVQLSVLASAVLSVAYGAIFDPVQGGMFFVSVASLGVLNVAYFYCANNGVLKGTKISNVLKNTFAFGFVLLAALFKPEENLWYVLAFTLGNLLTTVILLFGIRDHFRLWSNFGAKLAPSALAALFRENLNVIAFSYPGILINTLALQLPLIIAARLYADEQIALLAILLRSAGFASLIVVSSYGQEYYRKLSAISLTEKGGEVLKATVSSVWKPSIILSVFTALGVAMYCLLFTDVVLSYGELALVLGSLLVWSVVRSIYGAVTFSFSIRRMQHFAILFQSGLLFGVVLVGGVTMYLGLTFFAYYAGTALSAVVFYIWGLRLANKVVNTVMEVS